MANSKSKLRAMLEQGCIAECYTLNGYFVKVYPCFEIDKVKFSFVMKGKKGEGFDIYVDTDDFSLLCDDIESFRMAQKISKDAGQYPGAWKYTTGENGALSVAIGKSQKGGIVVQGRNGNTKVNAFVPLTGYNDLRKMGFLYDILSGKKPVTGYYAELAAIFWNRPKWNDGKNASANQQGNNAATNNKQINDRRGNGAPANTQQPANRYGNNAPVNGNQQSNRYGSGVPTNMQPNNSSASSKRQPQGNGASGYRQPNNRYAQPTSAPAQQHTAPPPPPGINELDVPFDEMPNYGSGTTL